MPRAAATEPDLERDAPAVCTTRRAAKSSSASEPALAEPGQQRRWENALAVATAFITNLSGGAACYELDLGLVAKEATSLEFIDAVAEMRNTMVFADTAGWTVKGHQRGVAIVAHATKGGGIEASTTSQEFVLRIDLAATAPITGIVVSKRVNKSSRPEWVLMPSPDEVAAGAGVCSERFV